MGSLLRVAMEENEQAPRWFRIDPNVRLGDLLILATLILSAASAWHDVRGANERTTNELHAHQAYQAQRDSQQDTVVTRIEVNLKDGIQTIRNDQIELRREVGEIGRYVRNRGG